MYSLTNSTLIVPCAGIIAIPNLCITGHCYNMNFMAQVGNRNVLCICVSVPVAKPLIIYVCSNTNNKFALILTHQVIRVSG